MSIASVVYTNSVNSDVIKVFKNQYKKHCKIPLFTVSDKDADHVYKNEEPYYKHWINALEKIEEDYFIYNQDDFFLYDDVETTKIHELVKILGDSNWPYIRLIKTGSNLSVSKPLTNENNLYEVGKGSFPQYSMQATVWKKDKFIELYTKTKAQKWFECDAYEQVCKESNLTGLYYYNNEPLRGARHYDSTIYPYIATAVVRGRWNTKEYESELSNILLKNNIDINKRGRFF